MAASANLVLSQGSYHDFRSNHGHERVAPGSVSRAKGFPAPLLGLWAQLFSLVSGCSLMLTVRLHLMLLSAVCCFLSAALVHIGCLVPVLASLGLATVPPFCVVGPRAWAGSPSWSVPYEVP